MAKQSKLDREIEKAQGEYDEAEMSYCIAGRVLMALKEAKSEDGKANNVPKVKRGRKAKGLPKPNGAEVTQ